MAPVNAETCQFVYIDFDINDHRAKLALAASFVNATDSRYGFSSNDLRKLGGSELSRVPDLMNSDHEWSAKRKNGIELRPPSFGSRVVIKLFWEIAPLCCENFATLCTNGGNSLNDTDKKVKKPPVGESGKELTYRMSKIHRLIPGFIVQGGDFVFGNGSGGESIFNGKKFKDEKAGLQLKHDRKGVVSMGNSGKNSNTSQFFITLNAAHQCDGKHVVFGEVVSGLEVLDAIESIGSHDDSQPKDPIVITDCGAFKPFETEASGYWYDKPDHESFQGITPIFMTRPRVAIVTPTNAVSQKFEKLLEPHTTPSLISLEDYKSENEIISKIYSLLDAFTIDMVLLAPACSHLNDDIIVPEMFFSKSLGLMKSSVVLTSKPVDALNTVWKKSWVFQKSSNWFLDGISNLK
mmetsp:Transcript_7981/g.11390  ORF Transcript_7981/g.11390 Transcript_7981/m.11390 type:complete len:407 (+) Transcript_7981:143-1363(+)